VSLAAVELLLLLLLCLPTLFTRHLKFILPAVVTAILLVRIRYFPPGLEPLLTLLLRFMPALLCLLNY